MKNLIPWVCVGALLVGVYFVYSAGQSKEAELTRLRQEGEELTALKAENEELKKLPDQSVELARLRKDNDELLRLRNEVKQLRDQGKQLTNKMLALQNDQTRREDQFNSETQALRDQNKQIAQVTLRAAAQTAQTQADACVNNLRQIDGAKQQWALETGKSAEAMPTAADLLPYFPQNAFPVCPAGGGYSLNDIKTFPTCSIASHNLKHPANAP
jgi:hypothetical protein